MTDFDGEKPTGPDAHEVLQVDVALDGDRTCPVRIGAGVRHELASAIPDTASRVAVVTQESIPFGVDAGGEQREFTIGDGESHKRLSTIEDLCSQWADWGLSRADCVVGLGGGLVTDVAGFAASVYHRGMPVIHVSTTLLGQIDASVGGKTGVNLLHGKNLVGTFWQPLAVFCDTETLRTLPAAEWRCGLGEMAKYNWLGGQELDRMPLTRRIAQCVRIKAEIVAADEREGGVRALLNYGHTLAHALEVEGGHELRHGEAVGIGLVYAAELAHRLGRIDDGVVAEHRRVVGGYDLPMRIPGGSDPQRLVELMRRDKKSLGSGLTFVLLGDEGLEVVAGVDESMAASALDAVS